MMVPLHPQSEARPSAAASYCHKYHIDRGRRHSTYPLHSLDHFARWLLLQVASQPTVIAQNSFF